MGNVLIVAEQQDGKLRSATLNAVSFGKKLSEVSGGGDLVGLVVGADVAAAAGELSKLGLSKVLVTDHPDLKQYAAETFAPAVASAARSVSATHVCATATSTGKDLMPRVAALLDTAMVSDVSEVLEARKFRRPMVAGNALATVQVTTDTLVATARQTEWPQAEPTDAEAPIEQAAVESLQMLGAEITSVNLAANDRPDLAEAAVVVSGGRGLKSKENFKYIEDLADSFGAAIGATRAACDAGLVPNDLQVGQTGKVVAPDLYVAVGISGAIQHLAGMKGSKVIVAINKDAEAPIFQVADYGLVAKWEDALPQLIDKLKAIKAS
jgi:electron transfer flavoprotein alpha subunit